MNAADDVVKIIVTQGEKRLDGQCDFVASASLAAATVAVGAAAAELFGATSPVSVGAIIGTIGFSLAAWLALWSGRACNFHAAGWYPSDFAGDVEQGRTARDIEVDFVLDLSARCKSIRRCPAWRTS